MKSIKHLFGKASSALFKDLPSEQAQPSIRVVSALRVALGCGSDLPFSVIGRFSRQCHMDRGAEKAEG